jgi:hypothetical protein
MNDVILKLNNVTAGYQNGPDILKSVDLTLNVLLDQMVLVNQLF